MVLILQIFFQELNMKKMSQILKIKSIRQRKRFLMLAIWLKRKTDFSTKITEVEGKTPNISRLATSSALTAVENKIPDISSLATTSALTAVENKIPDITGLVTKTDFDAKLKAISDRVAKINLNIYL